MCLPCPPDHCCTNGTTPTEYLHPTCSCLYIIGSGLHHRNAMFCDEKWTDMPSGQWEIHGKSSVEEFGPLSLAPQLKLVIARKESGRWLISRVTPAWFRYCWGTHICMWCFGWWIRQPNALTHNVVNVIAGKQLLFSGMHRIGQEQMYQWHVVHTRSGFTW